MYDYNDISTVIGCGRATRLLIYIKSTVIWSVREETTYCSKILTATCVVVKTLSTKFRPEALG